MPTPITHLAIALVTEPRALEPGFLAGSIFPDVRHLGGVTREVSHRMPLDTTAAFLAGIACHVRADELWNREFDIVRDYGPNPWVAINAYRLLVDEIIHGKIMDWSVAIADLIPSSANPLPFPLDDVLRDRWLTTVRDYVTAPPSAASRFAFARTVDIHPEHIAGLEDVIVSYKSDERIMTACHAFIDSALCPKR